MDVVKEIKNVLSSGSVTVGSNTTKTACIQGEVSLVIVAANCPLAYIQEMKSNHPEVVLHQLDFANRDLGTACGKPFPVAVIGIKDAGSSEILTLEAN